MDQPSVSELKLSGEKPWYSSCNRGFCSDNNAITGKPRIRSASSLLLIEEFSKRAIDCLLLWE